MPVSGKSTIKHISTAFDYKQIIIVRSDLKMTKGKTAVQVAHGAVSAVENARNKWSDWFDAWFHEGQKKVVAKVASRQELFELKMQAKEYNLPFALIQDAGLTELPPGTITVLAIGPAPEKYINKITDHLKLL